MVNIDREGTMHSEKTRAFNRGSDARIFGLARKANPYGSRHSNTFALYWDLGWNHADKNWAIDVRGRWPIRKLPMVI